jgi:tRNA dimethylallyltransferase
MNSGPVIALVGATATGKTPLAERVAERLGGEVVCADSRQVFRRLEIGTGKPPPAERAARPHHLFDALEIGEPASAGWYARAAAGAVVEIRARGALPVLVGGSGFYLAAVMEGLAAMPPVNPKTRHRLAAELDTLGLEAMHRRLAEVDPVTAARLATRDTQRILRALEVHSSTGRPLSAWHEAAREPAFQADWRIYEMVLEPALLKERIAARTAAMFAGGLIEETRALIDEGFGAALHQLRAIGYDEALERIAGTLSPEEAEERTTKRTIQLARRQRTWLRHQIEAEPLDAREPVAGLAERIAAGG